MSQMSLLFEGRGDLAVHRLRSGKMGVDKVRVNSGECVAVAVCGDLIVWNKDEFKVRVLSSGEESYASAL